MRLKHLCDLDLHYDGEFHLVRPYGNESGTGWGRGGGSVVGERLRGDYAWSNHPRRRGDGMMLPAVRGVVTTDDDAQLVLELTGRTAFDSDGVGHQMMVAFFETEHPAYSWLNDVICLAEGRIDPGMKAHIVVWVCEPGRAGDAELPSDTAWAF
jgi:hypothetical protein